MWGSLASLRGLGPRDPGSNPGIPIFTKMKKRRVSIIIFFNNQGKLLIQDRKGYKKGADYGFFGGKIEEGETPEEALKREIKEELTINIKDFSLFKHYLKYYPEKDLQIEYWVYYALMPQLKEIIVKEGGTYLTNFKDVENINMSTNDLKLIKNIHVYLRRKKLIE